MLKFLRVVDLTPGVITLGDKFPSLIGGGVQTSPTSLESLEDMFVNYDNWNSLESNKIYNREHLSNSAPSTAFISWWKRGSDQH